MTAVAEKYWAIAKVNYLNNNVYIKDVIVRGLTIPLRIWIFTLLYSSAYTMNGLHQINGFNVPMIIWVLMIAQSFDSSMRPAVSVEVENEVKSGDICYALVRPYSYILYHFFTYLGKFSARVWINLIAGILSAWFFVGLVEFSMIGIAACAVLLIQGIILSFLLSFLIGLLSFWVEDISGYEWLYAKSKMLLGGMLIPLAIFPDWLAAIAQKLPFALLFYIPASLAINFEEGKFLEYLGMQIFWVLVIGSVVIYTFKKGVKHVTTNGG
jgi:ABC-2 type transport system permease protein